jgi:IS5 family transposase
MTQNTDLINKLKNIKSKIFVADAGYCSHKNRNILRNNKINSVIKFNKRNNKKVNITFTKNEQKIYNKRVNI